ncbi:hypothetical protein N9A49_05100 [Salibacteraceae bacterium]|nr:hypothetical protein [Salibacteraceae bacterium]MDB4104498.1 hypothetical protein [Salibacteraceae bacterium]MDB9710066.1 hypothetical protein [Salibacteraceae bacterium]
MKKTLLYLLAGELFVFCITACNIDELAFRPTYAIPVVEARMTIGEILNSRPSEVESTFEKAFGTDSLFNFQLVYTDTLEPLTFESFAGTGNSVPARSYPNLFKLRSVFLRMTGNTESGDFRFINPRVDFVFNNEMKTEFHLRLDSTYTKNVKTGVEFPFDINDTAIIQPGSSASPGLGTLSVTNENTNGALTDVFSPTPKFMFYKPLLSVPAQGTAESGERLNIYAKVTLPFTGYGQAVRNDTIPYSIGEDDVDEIDAIDFIYLRMAFENELPLEVTVNAFIVDTISWDTLAQVRLYNSQTGIALNGTAAVVPAATPLQTITSTTTTTPAFNSSDMRLYKENPTSGLSDIETLFNGNAILLNMSFKTTGYDNSETVSIYSSQALKFNMGIKTRIDASITRDSLTNLIGL